MRIVTFDQSEKGWFMLVSGLSGMAASCLFDAFFELESWAC